MIMNSRDKNVQAKQEGHETTTTTATDNNINMISSSKASSTSRQWAGFKNPRIVRVSRTFGGKDRHSKVCTIRGLRDRRIRLSVPTAIQLYDLQDRLGLNQPSKVVDWLLDATKDDIDKLPPLQLPPGNFTQFHHQPSPFFSQESIAPQASFSHFFNAYSSTMKDENTQKGININDHFDGNDHQTSLERSRYWNNNSASADAASAMRAKDKEDERETGLENDQENLENNYGGYVTQLSAQNFFPVANQSPFPGVLNNNTMPYNPYFHWEPSNLSLSQFGNHSLTFQAEDHSQNHQSLTFPSSIPIPSGSQLYFCPSVTTMPSIIPPYPPYLNTSVENDTRQMNHQLQLLSSSSSSQHVQPSNFLMPTLHLMSSPMTLNVSNHGTKLPPSQENDDNSQMNEGDSGS